MDVGKSSPIPQFVLCVTATVFSAYWGTWAFDKQVLFWPRIDKRNTKTTLLQTEIFWFSFPSAIPAYYPCGCILTDYSDLMTLAGHSAFYVEEGTEQCLDSTVLFLEWHFWRTARTSVPERRKDTVRKQPEQLWSFLSSGSSLTVELITARCDSCPHFWCAGPKWKVVNHRLKQLAILLLLLSLASNSHKPHNYTCPSWEKKTYFKRILWVSLGLSIQKIAREE